ncbi:hypothetical protein CGZ93_16990 [Enemella dayhoffiae]|uniref:Uncharacterized protein n=1 Tax=Enemella dayhoffiae TaxID=2016507 RepID=A0A255GN58_9ACTN|nr:hypothetical protein CGZ93_16990 [Enemella dayhoffiae]
MARVSFACAIPSAIWRLLMLGGLLPGTADLRAMYAETPGYVIGLSVVQLSAGFLTTGLVSRWGRQLGPLRINPWFPVIAGTIGGAIVTWLFSIDLPLALLRGVRPDSGLLHGSALALMVACYAPIFVWGPLVLTSVAGFARHRLRPLRNAATTTLVS